MFRTRYGAIFLHIYGHSGLRRIHIIFVVLLSLVFLDENWLCVRPSVILPLCEHNLFSRFVFFRHCFVLLFAVRLISSFLLFSFIPFYLCAFFGFCLSWFSFKMLKWQQQKDNEMFLPKNEDIFFSFVCSPLAWNLTKMKNIIEMENEPTFISILFSLSSSSVSSLGVDSLVPCAVVVLLLVYWAFNITLTLKVAQHSHDHFNISTSMGENRAMPMGCRRFFFFRFFFLRVAAF